MSDETPENSGLFGKLPRSRPGIRSARRPATDGGSKPPPQPPKRTQARPTQARPKASAARSKPAASRPRPSPPPRPRSESAPKSGSDPSGEPAGLEELAWAGIAVTAEAATLGVRLVTRALDAARRATER
jgi:hypothetical protein